MILLVTVLLWSLPPGACGYANYLTNTGFVDLNGSVPTNWTLTGAGARTTVDGNLGMALESQDPTNPTLFSQRVNHLYENTPYSVSFWAYRNTSTATQSSNTYNLTLSYASQTSTPFTLGTDAQNYTFNVTVTAISEDIQWSAYDASGAIIIGLPCLFLPFASYEGPNSGDSTSANDSSATSSSTNTPAIVGGAVGGIIGVILLIVIVVGFLRWRRTHDTKQQQEFAPVGDNDLSARDTEEGKVPVEFSPPWSIPPSHGDPVVDTSPVMAAPTNATLAWDGSATNLNESSRNDAAAIVPSLTYSPSPTTPAPTFISSPPGYASTSSPRSIGSGSRTLSHALQLQGTNGVMFIDDDLGRWAAANRDSIEPELEQKLRIAHYRPMDDPKQISDTDWKEQYGVGVFELKRIQELYERQSFASDVKAKDIHSSGQGGHWHGSEI